MKSKTLNKYLVLKKSNIHNHGIFANENIPKNTRIIEYIGEKVTKQEGDKRADKQYKRAKKNKNYGSVYVFELNDKYDIDGNVTDNYARLINHSCNPNSRYKIIKGHIWIISKRNIKKGEEITYDYDYDLVDFHNHPCKCNSKECLGYIVGKQYRKKLMRRMNKN